MFDYMPFQIASVIRVDVAQEIRAGIGRGWLGQGSERNNTNWENVTAAREICVPKIAGSGRVTEGTLHDTQSV